MLDLSHRVQHDDNNKAMIYNLFCHSGTRLTAFGNKK